VTPGRVSFIAAVAPDNLDFSSPRVRRHRGKRVSPGPREHLYRDRQTRATSLAFARHIAAYGPRSHSPRARLVHVGGAFARAPGRIGGYGVEFAVNRAKLSDEVLDDFDGREVSTGDAACFARGHIAQVAHLPLPPE